MMRNIIREQKIERDNNAIYNTALEEGRLDGQAIIFSEMVKIAYNLARFGYHMNFIMECTQLSEEHIRELIKRAPIKVQRPCNYLNDSETFGLHEVRNRSRNEVIREILPRKIKVARKLKTTNTTNWRIAECLDLSVQDVAELKSLSFGEIVHKPRTDQDVKLDSQIAFDYAREQGREEERYHAERKSKNYENKEHKNR